MNKERVNALLPAAYQTLQDVGIADHGSIPKAFRGQVSSFGAAVTNGSLLAAIAFFSAQQGASVPREKIPQAINELLKFSGRSGEQDEQVYTGTINGNLFDTVRACAPEQKYLLQEQILDCAIALKLAMNLYKLTDDKKKEQAPADTSTGEEAAS